MFAHFQIIHCYGTRVAVISVPAPTQLKTEIALNVVGPGAFGYDVEFCPLPGGVIGLRSGAGSVNSAQ